MKKIIKLSILLITCLVVLGCQKNQSTRVNTVGYSTWDIIEKTEAMAPRGLKGEFVLTIKNSGQQSNRVFLNTESDYRDRRNITVTLAPSFQQAFKTAYNEDILGFYKNKTIRVKGEAKRMTIWFFAAGKRTEKYYFQTHILVNELSQIEIQ